MTARFAGRVALVTGASRGIGTGIAERLAAEGAAVAIAARTIEEHPTLPGSLTETAEQLRSYGNPVMIIAADMAKEEDRARLVGQVEAELGRLDVLVNNAAAAVYQPMADYPLKRRRLTMEVNFHAPLDLASAAIPGMRERGEGWIVNLSSASAGLQPGPPFRQGVLGTTTGVYGASKAALNKMTNALAAELYGTGIRVNTVEPRAAVASPGADAVLGDQLDDDMYESLEQMVEGAVALCDCPEDLTGRVCVSLDLIDELGLTVHGLDGVPLSA